MNRIDARFKDLSKRNEPAFIPFITAGDPSLEVTKSLILEFDKIGSDMIELGIPFSDPIADGPVIQASYFRALSSGARLSNILDLVRDIRKESEIPIVSMISHSILYKKGCSDFIKNAANAGFDGATIPDLPVEEAEEVIKAGERYNFKIACFIAPTTTDNRAELIVRNSRGFLYYISVVGITGVRNKLPDDLSDKIRSLKKFTNLPVALGFGISTPEQAKAAGKIADGVIVGSAIVREIEKYCGQDNKLLVGKVGKFVSELVNSTKNRD